MIIYVLFLEDGKYYIGKTENIEKRIEKHKNGGGSEWVKLHPFREVLEQVEGDIYDEDKITIKYMDRFGIENVRGGSYSNIELTFLQTLSIYNHLRSAKDQCYACGKRDHFIVNCGEEICMRCGRVGHQPETCKSTTHFYNGKLNGCYRCGRPDHWAFRCNRTRDIFGRVIKQPSFFIYGVQQAMKLF